MGQGYYRNVDDSISDPTLIETNYRVGRSAYFEVNLTLAEFADSISSLSGGLAGSPDLAQSLVTLPDNPNVTCPEVNQYVWIDDYKTVKVKTLPNMVGQARLYNPITRNFNLLKSAEIVKDQPLFRVDTARGVSNLTSKSHVVIMTPGDRTGVALHRLRIGDSVLTFDEGKDGKVKNWNIYADAFSKIAVAGRGDVVKIELETEFIYVSGANKHEGIVCHNEKDF